MNRRLATAFSLSLGGHAVLLAVIGLGLPQRPGLFSADEPHAGILSASVSLQSPEPVSSDAGSSIDPPLPEPAEPVEPVTPAGEIPSVDQADLQADEAAADAIAGESGQTGMEAAESSQHPESTGGFFTGSASDPAETGINDAEPVLLSSLNPVYPVMARRAGLEGVVIIEVIVDRFGRPVDYCIQPPRSHRLLEESAVTAVMNARFQPGLRGGNPVQDSFRVTVRFELKS